MIIQKKFLAGVMITSLIVSQTIYVGAVSVKSEIQATEVYETEIQTEEDINLLDEMLPETKENLSPKSKKVVDKVEKLAEDSAIDAAEALNQIQDDSVYEAALKGVLDNYYSEEQYDSEGQVAAFSEAVDERADDLLENYKAAMEERDNSKNLEYETGKVLVTFEAGTKEEDIAEIAGRMGNSYSILNGCPINENLTEEELFRLEAVRDREYPVIAYMDIGLDKTVDMANDIMENLSCVSSSEPNGIMTEVESLKSDLGVNDARVNEQTYLAQIKVPEAKASWNKSGVHYGSTEIAVIDTGLDISHEDLKNQYIKDKSVSLILNGTNVAIQKMDAGNAYLKGLEDSYHGTAVAGIIAAQTNNAVGMVGVSSSVNDFIKIMAINASSKGVDENGKPVCRFSDAVLTTAIYYAVNNGAEVINMSLGGPSYNSAIQEAINYAYAAGVVVCAASGNSALKGNPVIYPAAYNHVISVGAVNKNNVRASFSSYNSYVDIAAPGEGILSSVLGSKYGNVLGTSFAAPMVAAAVGILGSMRSNNSAAWHLSADDIESILCSTATDLNVAGKDIYTGCGLLNLNLAVQAAKARFLVGNAPKNIQAEVKSYNSIKVSCGLMDWADRYQIYRSTSLNGTYEKIKVIHYKDYDESNVKLIYKDTGLDTDTTYYYKIRAVSEYQDGVKHSAYSSVVSAKPILSVPSISLAVSSGKITVSWKKIDGATDYGVFRSTSKTGTYTKIKNVSGGSTVTYVDTSVKAGKTYFYKVRAFRTAKGKTAKSEFSGIVSIKAK